MLEHYHKYKENGLVDIIEKDDTVDIVFYTWDTLIKGQRNEQGRIMVGKNKVSDFLNLRKREVEKEKEDELRSIVEATADITAAQLMVDTTVRTKK